MPSKDFSFNPVKPGDAITADAWNTIGNQVMRITGVPGPESISTGAGVFSRRLPSTAGTALGFFELSGQHHREKNSDAVQMELTAGVWGATGETFHLDGQFVTGWWYTGDVIAAMYSTDASKWYSIGCGRTMMRGELQELLGKQQDYGEKVSVSQTTLGASGAGFTGTGVTIRAMKVMGVVASLDTGSVVTMEWHEQSTNWAITGGECVGAS